MGQAAGQVVEMVRACTCCQDCAKRTREVRSDGKIIDCHTDCLAYLLDDAIWQMDLEEERQQRELDQFHYKMTQRRRRKK